MLSVSARQASVRSALRARGSVAYRLRHERGFGRGPVRVLGNSAPAAAPAFALSENMKLFASTFAAGFLFMTVFLA